MWLNVVPVEDVVYDGEHVRNTMEDTHITVLVASPCDEATVIVYCVHQGAWGEAVLFSCLNLII